MMFRLVVFLLPGLLWGCGGSESHRFTVAVDVPLERAYAELGSIEDAPAVADFGFPRVKVEKSPPDTLRFVYRSAEDYGEGALLLTFERIGERKTGVHAELFMPDIQFMEQGNLRRFDKDAAFERIKDSFEDWAEQASRQQSTASQRAAIANALGVLPLALSPQMAFRINRQRLGPAAAVPGAQVALPPELRAMTMEEYAAATGQTVEEIGNAPIDPSVVMQHGRPVDTAPAGSSSEDDGGWGDNTQF